MTSGPRWRVAVLVFGCALGVLPASGLRAQMGGGGGIEMPDMKQMSGIPRPVGDLPPGTVAVRLIRGSLSNNITGHEVSLEAAGKVLNATTDDTGHVEFKGLAPGTSVKAIATVDGERLESQQFPVPPQGGVRLMLVATDKEAEKKKAEEASAPAVSGQVVLGGESRIVIEPGDESLQIYYLLDIVNTARVPVNPPSLFMFDMPKGSTGTTILEGSSPQAAVNGTRVRVQGPFKPGRTSVQVAAELPVNGGTVQISQRFPASMEQLAVIAKKAGAMRLISPQLSAQKDMAADGQSYIAGTGGAVAAGAPVILTLDDVPHHSTLPRQLTLGAAAAIVLLGLWAARRPEDDRGRQADRQRLIDRREKLFAELVRLEREARKGRGDTPRIGARRRELFASLEHIYGVLDQDADGPVGAGAAYGPSTGSGPSRASAGDGELRAS